MNTYIKIHDEKDFSERYFDLLATYAARYAEDMRDYERSEDKIYYWRALTVRNDIVNLIDLVAGDDVRNAPEPVYRMVDKALKKITDHKPLFDADFMKTQLLQVLADIEKNS